MYEGNELRWKDEESRVYAGDKRHTYSLSVEKGPKNPDAGQKHGALGAKTIICAEEGHFATVSSKPREDAARKCKC